MTIRAKGEQLQKPTKLHSLLSVPNYAFIQLRMIICSLLFLEILFKCSTDLRSRPVEEHTLIGLGYPEEATGFL